MDDRDVWSEQDGGWYLGQKSATAFLSLAEAKNVVQAHNFFPCVVVKEEVLPEPEKESEIPSLTFQELATGETFIGFNGDDRSDHYLFKKIDEAYARNIPYDTHRQFSSKDKVIRVKAQPNDKPRRVRQD
jgi:hypothetical protein